jgi:hypothetical protein
VLEFAAPTGPDARLGREMVNQLRLLDEIRFHFQKLALNETESAEIARSIQVLNFPLRVVVAGQSINTRYLVTIVEQSLAQVRPDKAGTAGN